MSLRSLLLPTNIRHVLKFCKDPFKGVDGIDPPLTPNFWGADTQKPLRSVLF